MTREHAVEWLRDYLQNTPFQAEQYEKSFEMAIKALEDVGKYRKKAKRWKRKYEELLLASAKALSLEKTGEWIIHSEYDAIECSECGTSYPEYESFNYCPNCGCEMKGDRNEF